MPSPIARTLTYEDGEGRRKTVHQDEIADFRTPVVILGDPGMGKTVLTKALGDTPGMEYVKAGTFTRAATPETLIAEGGRIVIDGLDQIASAAPGSAVEAVLEKLSAMGNPLFILSCREADWLGAADRIKIKDDYGVAPNLLHLQPFSHDDARAFLSHEFPAVDADGLLNHLSDRGIEDLYGNPLTLRMFGEIAQADDNLPKSRAELFDRACRIMLREENPRHEQNPHALAHEEEIILAAGAACAAQILCDRIGVYTGPPSKAPGGFLNIADIKKLPLAEIAEDALRTRLFQSEGENRFTHIHRVIAEFLGAKWIARCFDDGVSERRIFALFRQGEGVPTSLRGLHAWTANFSEKLAGRCIAADPYAVLRYGDAEALSPDRARALLAALVQLSNRDPYFRSEDWGDHSASGLMRVELQDDIRAIVEKPGHHPQLSFLLLEAIAGTELARKLASTLDAIMFDRDRSYHERACAWGALRADRVCDDWEAAIRRLLDLKDADSARLACDVLTYIGAHSVSLETAIETILAYLGFAAAENAEQSSIRIRPFPDRLFRDLNSERHATLLDGLVQRAQPLMRQAGRSSQSDFADLVRSLTLRVLESDYAVEPARLWTWIGWLDGHRGYRQEVKSRLAAIFHKDQMVRSRLLEHVLLTPCADNTWMAGIRLSNTQLDLFPTAEDIAGILLTLRGRANGGAIDAELYRGLLLHGRSADGLPAVVRDAAANVARNDAELLSIVEEISDTTEPAWKIEQVERESAWKSERRRKLQADRDALAAREKEIAAGEIGILTLPAAVYLGQGDVFGAYYVFESEASPEERLRLFLGNELCERVLAGFVALLYRDDLPSASEIVDSHCQNKRCWVEAAMICGVAEMLRRGRPIDTIKNSTVAAVYMAWQRAPGSNALGEIDVASALESALFKLEADWETHFRTGIEPQLSKNLRFVEELHRLTNNETLASLAGRLAVDWLRRYPALRHDTQEQLLACAINNASDEAARALVRDRRKCVYPDYDTTLLWLSADYVIDFDNCREALRETATDNPNFLWLVRDRVDPDRSARISPDRNERFSRYSLDQLVYIVEAFGRHWLWTDRPMGTTTMGVKNPWDATEFIGGTIYAIAGRPTSDATEALQTLIASHAPTYTNTLRHALALQLRARRDSEYTSPTVGELCSAVTGGLPESIENMRAWFADRIGDLQERIRGSDTNMWETYWTDTAKPRGEEFCRDRLIEHVSVQLPPSIRLGPEARMPAGKRADIALTRNTLKLPVEIKGQWHTKVWTAASDQLDAKYTIDWQAEGRGVYIVLWFGDVPGKQLPEHPDGLQRPQLPEALRQMLIDRLPEARRASIDVFVVDVSHPVSGDR